MKLLGLDIGSSYLKYALRKGRRIVRCGRLRLIADPLRSSHEERLQSLQSAARNLMSELGCKRIQAAVSLSGFMTRTQVTALPAISGQQLDDVLYHETQALCPQGGEDILYNYALVPDNGGGQRYGVSCLARESEVEETLAVLASAGIVTVRVEFGPLVYAGLPDLTESAGVTAALEIGAKTSSLTVCRDGGLIACQHIPLGCEEALRGLEKASGCEREEALAALHWWLHESADTGNEEQTKAQSPFDNDTVHNTNSTAPSAKRVLQDSPDDEIEEYPADELVPEPAEESAVAATKAFAEEDALSAWEFAEEDEIDRFFSDDEASPAASGKDYVLTDEEVHSGTAEHSIHAKVSPASASTSAHASEADASVLAPDSSAQISLEEDLQLEETPVLEEEFPPESSAESEDVVDLDLSDYETGSEAEQQAQLQEFLHPQLSAHPRTALTRTLKQAAEQSFSAAFGRLLTTLYRSLFSLRNNEGIDPAAIQIRLGGYCAASPRMQELASTTLSVQEIRPITLPEMPAAVSQPAGLLIACGLALAGPYAPDGTPDMLPPSLAQRSEAKRLRFFRAACMLLALLPLPSLLHGFSNYQKWNSEVTVLNSSRQQREEELAQEKALTEKSAAQLAQHKPWLEFAAERENFFSLLPAFNDLGRDKIWLGEFSVVNDSVIAGHCRLQGWSFDALDSFVKRLREEKVCGEITLKSSDAGDTGEGSLTVGDIEGERAKVENKERFAEAEMLFTGGGNADAKGKRP